VINGKAALTPEMALRQEQWPPGPTAEAWLGLQMDNEHWQARRRRRPKAHWVAA
jgi:plasmid maintenance system antidote protein VapI